MLKEKTVGVFYAIDKERNVVIGLAILYTILLFIIPKLYITNVLYISGFFGVAFLHLLLFIILGKFKVSKLGIHNQEWAFSITAAIVYALIEYLLLNVAAIPLLSIYFGDLQVPNLGSASSGVDTCQSIVTLFFGIVGLGVFTAIPYYAGYFLPRLKMVFKKQRFPNLLSVIVLLAMHIVSIVLWTDNLPFILVTVIGFLFMLIVALIHPENLKIVMLKSFIYFIIISLLFHFGLENVMTSWVVDAVVK